MHFAADQVQSIRLIIQAEKTALAQIHTLCEGHAQALTNAQAWNVLRHIRNEFTHDYPETAELRFEKFTAAKDASAKLLALMQRFTVRISEFRLKLSPLA